MAMDVVSKYLKVRNRPYSVNDIVSNLQNEYNKGAVQKAVDQLVVEGKVFEKVYGKQKIYCIVQDSKHDTEELMRIDKELQAHANEVESKYQELDREIKAQEARLLALKSSITVEEAEREKATLQESVRVLTHKLDNLMESTSPEDLSEFKRKAENDMKQYSREYAKRKRLCTEIIECILENYPGTRTELYEEVGIEPRIVQSI